MEKDEMQEMEQTFQNLVAELKTAAAPDETVEFQDLYLDGTEPDNTRWKALLKPYLQKAKRFEIHCWNEETEWIQLALRYGGLKEADWAYGQIISGDVTNEFRQMLLGLPKPADRELYNKMTSFFQIFLDEDFQSCHYGTENYYR